jgi:hypothetical protein
MLSCHKPPFHNAFYDHCPLDEFFDFPVICKNEELLFSTRLLPFGYTPVCSGSLRVAMRLQGDAGYN